MSTLEPEHEYRYSIIHISNRFSPQNPVTGNHMYGVYNNIV